MGVGAFEEGAEAPLSLHAGSSVTPTAKAKRVSTRTACSSRSYVSRRSLRSFYGEREGDGSVEHLGWIALAIETDHYGIERHGAVGRRRRYDELGRTRLAANLNNGALIRVAAPHGEGRSARPGQSKRGAG